jgi:ribosomal-protein-alanine N-acetyltransferase
VIPLTDPQASNALRVFLDRPVPGGETVFLDAVHRSEALHRPWAFAPSTPEAHAEYLERIRLGRTIGFLVRGVADRSLVGVINAGEPVMGVFRSAYLGYYAFAGSERQGLMTEGLALVLDAAFDSLGMHRLEANVQPANAASLALVKRLGFRREGFSPRYLEIDGDWRDHERWAMLSEEWPEVRTRLFASRAADGRKSQHGKS